MTNLLKFIRQILKLKKKQFKGVNCIFITCGTCGQNLIKDCIKIKNAIKILYTEFKLKEDATHAKIHTK